MANGNPDQLIVINRRDLEKLPVDIGFDVEAVLDEALMYLPKNDYVLCDASKPYAELVKQIIAMGEELSR